MNGFNRKKFDWKSLLIKKLRVFLWNPLILNSSGYFKQWQWMKNTKFLWSKMSCFLMFTNKMNKSTNFLHKIKIHEHLKWFRFAPTKRWHVDTILRVMVIVSIFSQISILNHCFNSIINFLFFFVTFLNDISWIRDFILSYNPLSSQTTVLISQIFLL